MRRFFNGRVRWVLWCVLAAGVTLHVVNAVSLDALALLRSGQSFVERLEDAAGRARPEYQDLALATLPPNPNNGAFTRFDSAYVRSVDGAEEPAGSTGEFSLRWEFDDGTPSPLAATNGSMQTQVRDGVLVTTQVDGSSLVNSEPLALAVRDFWEVVVRVRADRGNRFVLSWALVGKAALLEDNTASLDLIADGEFHTYVVNLRRSLLRASEDLAGNVVTLAITPSNADGAEVQIDYLRVRSRQWEYAQEPIGTSYETVAAETRPVLYVSSGHTQGFDVDVPTEGPTLTFGAAALNGNGARLNVRIVADGASQDLVDEPLSATRWADWRRDLAAWRGRSIRLEFSATGQSDVVFVSSPLLRASRRRRANVVVIVEDTLRADHLSMYGHGRETAPVRSALFARSGVVFTNAYAQATETRPSVPSLLTSLYPSATGVIDFSKSLSERYLTLAEVLRAQGYDTASFVQNPNAGLLAGLHQGFDRLVSLDAAQLSTEAIVGDQVLGWLDGVRDDNFFLYLHVKDPHGVYDPPAPFDRWYREFEEDPTATRTPVESNYLDPEWLDEPSAEARQRLYDGEILHNDGIIGAFLAQLEQRGLLDDTLLVFTSDHGEWLGEDGYWDHHPPGKRPVIHVPLMMRHPTLLARPRRVDEVVQLIDVMPTILELVNVDSHRLLMHGTSLVSLMQGSPDWQDRVALSEEAVLMAAGDPCACGSIFFNGWQIHGSTYRQESRGAGASVDVLPFFRTSVSRVGDDGRELRFTPDILVRALRQRIFSRAVAANRRFTQRLTAGQAGDEYRMDPNVLEELRGLGYVR